MSQRSVASTTASTTVDIVKALVVPTGLAVGIGLVSRKSWEGIQDARDPYLNDTTGAVKDNFSATSSTENVCGTITGMADFALFAAAYWNELSRSQKIIVSLSSFVALASAVFSYTRIGHEHNTAAAGVTASACVATLGLVKVMIIAFKNANAKNANAKKKSEFMASEEVTRSEGTRIPELTSTGVEYQNDGSGNEDTIPLEPLRNYNTFGT